MKIGTPTNQLPAAADVKQLSLTITFKRKHTFSPTELMAIVTGFADALPQRIRMDEVKGPGMNMQIVEPNTGKIRTRKP